MDGRVYRLYMGEVRIEADTMGELEVPENALYAAQTQRAINNFPISGSPMPKAFIRALVKAKLAAAKANAALEQIPQSMSAAIVKAAEKLLADDDIQKHFPVVALCASKTLCSSTY